MVIKVIRKIVYTGFTVCTFRGETILPCLMFINLLYDHSCAIVVFDKPPPSPPNPKEKTLTPQILSTYYIIYNTYRGIFPPYWIQWNKKFPRIVTAVRRHCTDWYEI